MFLSVKSRLSVKIISLLVIQSFLFTNMSWALTQNSFAEKDSQDCLSPALRIMNPMLQKDMISTKVDTAIGEGALDNGTLEDLISMSIMNLGEITAKFDVSNDIKALFEKLGPLNSAVNTLKMSESISIENKERIELFMTKRSDLAKKVSEILVSDLEGNKDILEVIVNQSVEDMREYISGTVKKGKITQEQGDDKINTAIKYLGEWLNPENDIPLYVIQGTYRAMLEGRSGDLLYSYGFGWKQFGTAGIRNPVEQSEFPVLLEKELNEFAEDAHAPVLTGPNNINAVTLLQQVAAIKWLQNHLNTKIAEGESIEAVAKELGYDVELLENVRNNTITVTYDSRLNGEYFAHMQTAYFLEAGINVNLFDNPSGVPAGASIAHGPEMFGKLINDPRFAAFADIIPSSFGVLISASHSEAEYNGFKLFIGHQKSQLDGDSKKMIMNARAKVSYSDFNTALDTGNLEDLNVIFRKHKDQLTWLGGKEKLPEDKRDYCGAKFVPFYPLYFEYLKQRSPIPYDKLDKAQIAKINKEKETLAMLYTAFYGGGAITAANLPGFFEEMGYKNVDIVKKQTEQMDGRFPGHIMPDPGVVEGWMSNMLHFFQQISGEELVEVEKAIIAFNKQQMGGATDPDVDRAGMMIALAKGKEGNVKAAFIKWMRVNLTGIGESRKKEILKLLEETLEDKLLLTANESWTMLAYYKLQILEEFGLLDKNTLYTIEKSHVTTEGLESVAAYYREKGYHVYVIDTYVGFTELAKKGRDSFAIAKTSWKIKQAIDAGKDIAQLLSQLKQEDAVLKTNVPYQKQGLAIIDKAIELAEQGSLKEAAELFNVIAHIKNIVSCEESNGYGELGEYVPEEDKVANAHISEKDGGLALFEFLEMLAYGQAVLKRSGYEMFTDMLSKIGYAATDNQFLKYPGLTGIQEKTDCIENIEKMLAALIQKAMDEGKTVTMFNGKYAVKEVTIYRDKKYDVTYNGFSEEGIRLVLETKRGSLAMTTFRPSGTGDSNRDYNWVMAPAPAKGTDMDKYRLDTLAELEELRNDFFGVFNVLSGYADLPKEEFYGMLTALKEAGRDRHFEIFSKILDLDIRFNDQEQIMFDLAKKYAYETRKQDFENMPEEEKPQALEKVEQIRSKNLNTWENYLATEEAQAYPKKFNIYINGEKFLEVPHGFVKPWMASFSGFVADRLMRDEIFGAQITTDDAEVTNEINIQLKKLGYENLKPVHRDAVIIETTGLQSEKLGDLKQTDEEIDFLNNRLKEIQSEMQKENDSVNTHTGQDVLLKNMRGWVHGEKEWANQGIGDTITLAQAIRDDENVEAFVQVGVGGSDQTTKAIVNANISSQHNLLTKEQRGGAPLLFYTGDNFDPNVTYDILQALDAKGLLFKTIFNITSLSGTTAETIHTFLIIKSYLEVRLEQIREQFVKSKIHDEDLRKLGLTPNDLWPVTLNYTVTNADETTEDIVEKTVKTGRFFVFTTGQNEKSALYNYAAMIKEQVEDKVYGMLPVPVGTGGRYSFATAVGMLAMGVTANANKDETAESRINEVLQGVADARKELLSKDISSGENIPFSIARANYLAETQHGLGTLAVYPFASLLQEFSNLAMQISTESIQENGKGQNILALVGPGRNHSVVNGIISGPRDKIILFIEVAEFDEGKDATITGGRVFGGDLQFLENLKQSDIQNTSLQGTYEDMIENGVPAYKITIPALTPYYVAKLIAYFQHEVAIEGVLRGLRDEPNDKGVFVDLTYLQHSVVGYKNKTRAGLITLQDKLVQEQQSEVEVVQDVVAIERAI